MSESTMDRERARMLESTKRRERATLSESTIAGERAKEAESTTPNERAVEAERTKARERAGCAESTSDGERATPSESTKRAERAKPAESTKLRERAKPVRICGIDPGAKVCGYVVIEGESVFAAENLDPAQLETHFHDDLRRWRRAPAVAIEFPSHYGPDVSPGADTYHTCRLAGRLELMAEMANADGIHLVTRPQVKLHLLGVRRGTDVEIRTALCDLWGGKSVAIGGRRCKVCTGKGWTGRAHDPCELCATSGWEYEAGPLYGVTAHAWAALAVAVTLRDWLRDVAATEPGECDRRQPAFASSGFRGLS